MLVDTLTQVEISLESIVGALGREIQGRAGDSRGSEVSILSLEDLADQLDDLSAGIEAYLGQHMACVAAPVLDEVVPPWAAFQLDMISPELAPVKYQASCVVQVVEKISGSTLRGHITEGPGGSVEIMWMTPKHIRWLVQQPANKWPEVRVRVFYTGTNGKLKTRMFRWVDSLMSHITGYLAQEAT